MRADEAAPEPVSEEPQVARSVQQLVLGLQRSAGNQAVAGMLARRTLARQATDAGEKHGVFVSVEGVGEFEARSLSFGSKDDVHLTKATDATSAELRKRAASGEGVKVEIRMVKNGKTYMTIRIAGFVSSFQVGGGGGDDSPQEQLTFTGDVTRELPKDAEADVPAGAP